MQMCYILRRIDINSVSCHCILYIVGAVVIADAVPVFFLVFARFQLMLIRVL